MALVPRISSKQPTVQKFLSGSGTYTTPIGVKRIEIRISGGGGAGGSGQIIVTEFY